MRAKLKIWITRAFLPIFFVFSALAPSQAYAFVPEVVYITGAPVATGGAAVGTLAITAVALVALAIGTGVGYVAVDWATSGDDDVLVIPTTEDHPIVSPAAPTTANPTPPVYEQQYCYGALNPACGSGTKSGVCAAVGGTWIGGEATGKCYVNYAWCTQHYTPDTCPVSMGINSSVVDVLVTPEGCPAGYILNGSTCSLDSARTAQPDNKCDIGRTGATLAQYSDDPDCAAMAPKNIICNADGCTVIGTTDAGQPRRLVVAPRVDGGSDIYVQDQVNVNGQSQVQSGHVGIDAQGNVDAVSGSVNPGTVPTDGTAPVNDPAQETQIQFPTDYARTGEAATAAQGVRTDIQAQTQADADYRNGEQQRFEDRLGVPPSAELIPNTESPVSITAVTFSSAAGCPADIPFEMFGTSYGISYAPMCNVMSMMRPLFLAFGAIGAAMIFAGGLKS